MVTIGRMYAARICGRYQNKSGQGDNTPPKYNAYVVLTGSMLPEIKVKDVVVTKKYDPEDLEVNDIITFLSSDQRLSGIIVTHRIVGKFYDQTTGKYSFQTNRYTYRTTTSRIQP